MSAQAGGGATVRRAMLILGTLAALAVTAATPALAHGDAQPLDGSVMVPADGEVRLPVELHYHRLVVRLDADAPLGIDLVLTGTGEALVSVEPSRALRVNELARCCDDDAWAKAELVLSNPGPTPVEARGAALLVHDDLAVMVDGAEDGTRLSIVVLGGFLVWRLARSRRPDSEPTSLTRAAVAFASLVALVLVLGAVGGWWSGGAPAEAVVAGGGLVPVVPTNPIVSRASLLMGVAIFGWGFVATRWARAAGSSEVSRWRLVGVVLVLAPVAVAAAIASAYGRVGPPAVMAAVASVPLLVVLAMRPQPRTVGQGSA